MKDRKIDTDRMNENGMYLFMSKVNDDTVAPVIEWIIQENLNTENRKEYLILIICSPGGFVASCFALLDTMMGSIIPIRTVGIGQISSCGLMMFIAGEKGTRTLTPNTSILSHQFAGGCVGKEHELFAKAKEYGLLDRRIMRHYKKFTGLSEKDIRKKLLSPTDVYLDAKEALKLGICDKVKLAY